MCSTNLGEPLLVHMVHHHDLVVEGDRRAPGTETKQTEKQMSERFMMQTC